MSFKNREMSPCVTLAHFVPTHSDAWHDVPKLDFSQVLMEALAEATFATLPLSGAGKCREAELVLSGLHPATANLVAAARLPAPDWSGPEPFWVAWHWPDGAIRARARMPRAPYDIGKVTAEVRRLRRQYHRLNDGTPPY